MVTDDITLLNRHLKELHSEVAQLRQDVDEVARLAREATFQELLEILRPVLEQYSLVTAADEQSPAPELIDELGLVIRHLGLQAIWEPGDVVELWPDDAAREIALVRPPEGKDVATVEILASGWQRGTLVICRPRGRIIEVRDDGNR